MKQLLDIFAPFCASDKINACKLSGIAQYVHEFYNNTIKYNGPNAHIMPQLKECRYQMEVDPIGKQVLEKRPMFDPSKKYPYGSIGCGIKWLGNLKANKLGKDMDVYEYIEYRAKEVEEYLRVLTYSDGKFPVYQMAMYNQLMLPTMFMRIALSHWPTWGGVCKLDQLIEESKKIRLKYVLNVELDPNECEDSISKFLLGS